jgi:hypothetical protein
MRSPCTQQRVRGHRQDASNQGECSTGIVRHPSITMARLGLWTMGRFCIAHGPSRASMSHLLNCRREQLESLAGEWSPPAKKSRTPKGSDVQALALMVQFASEMHCQPSVTLELKRMLQARSVDPPAWLIACRFIWSGLSSCVVYARVSLARQACSAPTRLHLPPMTTCEISTVMCVLAADRVRFGSILVRHLHAWMVPDASTRRAAV